MKDVMFEEKWIHTTRSWMAALISWVYEDEQHYFHAKWTKIYMCTMHRRSWRADKGVRDAIISPLSRALLVWVNGWVLAVYFAKAFTLVHLTSANCRHYRRHQHHHQNLHINDDVSVICVCTLTWISIHNLWPESNAAILSLYFRLVFFFFFSSFSLFWIFLIPWFLMLFLLFMSLMSLFLWSSAFSSSL